MHLKIVMQILHEHKLYAKLSKCSFAQKLFFFVFFGSRGWPEWADPKKVSVVKDWPVPQNRLQVQSFLGIANYFRNLMVGSAALVHPLRHLCKDSVKFVWTEERQHLTVFVTAMLRTVTTQRQLNNATGCRARVIKESRRCSGLSTSQSYWRYDLSCSLCAYLLL